jgi:hypothetical protein
VWACASCQVLLGVAGCSAMPRLRVASGVGKVGEHLLAPVPVPIAPAFSAKAGKAFRLHGITWSLSELF